MTNSSNTKNDGTELKLKKKSRKDMKKKLKSAKKKKLKDLKNRNFGVGLKISIDTKQKKKFIELDEVIDVDDKNTEEAKKKELPPENLETDDDIIEINGSDDEKVENENSNGVDSEGSEDDKHDDFDGSRKKNHKEKSIKHENNFDDDDDDDDSFIEEVKASDARAQAQLQRNVERKTKTFDLLQKASKKRNKTTNIKIQSEEGESSSDDDDDTIDQKDDEDEDENENDEDILTEDFFSQVDSQRQQDKKNRNIEKRTKSATSTITTATPFQGRHKKFTSDDFESINFKNKNNQVLQTNDTNMEVVVLNDNYTTSISTNIANNNAFAMDLGAKPSKLALSLSRTNIDKLNKESKQWKRSKKMKYKRQNGSAACAFAVRAKP